MFLVIAQLNGKGERFVNCSGATQTSKRAGQDAQPTNGSRSAECRLKKASGFLLGHPIHREAHQLRRIGEVQLFLDMQAMAFDGFHA